MNTLLRVRNLVAVPVLTVAAMMLLSPSTASAVTVFSQDFEGGGLGCGSGPPDLIYSPCQAISGGAPFWEAGTGDNVPNLSIGGAGNTALLGAGLNGSGGTGDSRALFPSTDLDISGFTGLVLTLDIA